MKRLLAVLLLAGCGGECNSFGRGFGFGFDDRTPTAAGLTNQYSVLFDGTNESYTIATEDALECDDEDALTVCVWAKMTTVTSAQTMVGMWDASTRRTWNMETNGCSGNTCAFLINVTTACTTGGAFISSAATYDFSVWAHYCATVDGGSTTVTLYRNGASVAHGGDAGPATIPACGSEVGIGDANGLANREWDGNIDEPVVWCEALSAAEILAVYNSGVPADPLTLADTTPRVWLRMGDDTTLPDDETALTNLGTAGNAVGNNLEAADVELDVP